MPTTNGCSTLCKRADGWWCNTDTLGYTPAAGDFNSGKFTPYPATLSRARVSVEDAPVVMLDPGNAIFHSPNEITQKDFAGWVQERGLYFMSQWDPKFTPLLESHDPGVPNGHFVAAGQAGDIFAHRIVEREFAFFLKQQDRRRGELLGDGANGVAHLGRGCEGGGGCCGEASAAVSVRVDQLAALDHGQRCGGNAGLVENLLGNAVDAILQGRVERVNRLRLRDCCQQDHDYRQTELHLLLSDQELTSPYDCAHLAATD